MKAGFIFSCFCFFTSYFFSPLFAAKQEVIKKWNPHHQEFIELEHLIENLDFEITQMRSQIETQGLAIEILREDQLKSQQRVKDSLLKQEERIDSKISSVEKKDFFTSEEMKALRDYIKESNAALAKYREKIEELEKKLKANSSQTQELETALRSVIDLLQTDSTFSLNSIGFYQVQSGDTLEKIAKQQGTSVKALKEANGLSSDLIPVGKKLKLPKG